jgi:hypothetical protein
VPRKVLELVQLIWWAVLMDVEWALGTVKGWEVVMEVEWE